MKSQFEPGQPVKVTTPGGDVVDRIVVTDLGRTVVVCSKAEYDGCGEGETTADRDERLTARRQLLDVGSLLDQQKTS